MAIVSDPGSQYTAGARESRWLRERQPAIDLRTLTLIGAILTLSAVLRAFAFSGYVSGDDAAYITHALAFLSGDEAAPYSHWGTRTLLVLLTAASFSIFGVNEFSTAFFPMLFSLGSVAVAYRLADRLFDQKVALLAAMLVAILPMEVVFASHLFPYAFISCLSALCLLVFLEAEDRNSVALYFVAGVVLGLTYLSRITGLYGLLFFGLYCLWMRRFRPGYIWFAGGLVAVLLADMAFYYLTTENALHRLDVLTGRAGQHAAQPDSAALNHLPDLGWLVEPLVRPLFEQELGFFFLALMCVALWQLSFGTNRSVKLLLFWIIPIFLYTCYGTTSPFEYKVLRRLPRYLSPIIVPGMILIAWQLATIHSRKLRAMVLTLLIGSAAVSLLVDNSRNMTVREQHIADYIDDHPDQNYALPRTLFFDVAFYRGFPNMENVTLIEKPGDRSHTLRRIKIVMPNVRSTVPDERQCGERVFVDHHYIQMSDIGRELAWVEEFRKPQVLYARLLANPVVLDLVGLIRDPRRIKALRQEASTSDSVVLYEVPCTPMV